jgi:hypothetical protein
VLVVSQVSETDAERLQKGLNETLRPYERIAMRRSVTSIPRSDLGKARLEQLRELL